MLKEKLAQNSKNFVRKNFFSYELTSAASVFSYVISDFSVHF